MGPHVSNRQHRKHETMPLYEHVFLARQDLAQAQVDALAETPPPSSKPIRAR